MTAGIYFNRNYVTDNMPYVDKIEKSLKKQGHACKIVNDFSDLDGLEVLFVLGGDGTILMVAAECAVRGIKIIGINYGHVGFLTEFEPEKIDDAIALVTGNSYTIQKRSMLEISFGDRRYLALNDLVIQRSTGGSDFSNTVNIQAEIDGATVDNFSSDGLVISTPTGSTAYSLAAGGSVLSPELEAFILTPICAHSLHSRPVVFSDKSTLTVSPVGAKASLVIAVDGRVVDSIKEGKITVKKSQYAAQFITVGDKNFFNKLLIKLNIWSK